MDVPLGTRPGIDRKTRAVYPASRTHAIRPNRGTLMARFAIPVLAGALVAASQGLAADPPKKVVLIAGAKSHGPGEHEYEKGVRLLAHCLNTSPSPTRPNGCGCSSTASP